MVLTRLHELALSRSPNEAVGLMLPDDQVIELVNRSQSPADSFMIQPSDIAIALENNKVNPATLDWENTTFWHTHPSGGVGPSRTDMRNKLPHMAHLVLTLTPTGCIPTWY